MLTLYYRPTCPFCHYVLSAAHDLGVSFTLKNISEDSSLIDELIKRGGKKQVPYFVDDERGVEMYESRDIIAYLEEHYSNNVNEKNPEVE